jgi:signal transduction histidine kinase
VADGITRSLRDNGQVKWRSDRPARLTRRQIALDLALAAAITVASLKLNVLSVRVHASLVPQPASVPVSGMFSHAALLAVLARTAPLTIRRLYPVTAFWLCLGGCALAGLPGGSVVNLVALAPAAYSALVYSPYWVLAMVGMPAALLVLASGAVADAQSGNYELLTGALVFVSVLIVGSAVRLGRRRASDSQARLRRVEAEQEAATRQAIEQERARIARELHDVVAHNVSMMVVQAGAARRVLSSTPDEARTALLAVEDSGRATIVELQHLLGLLAPPGGADESPPPPQPGLDQVRPLIDRVTTAGLPVKLRVHGPVRPLPPGLDLAAYRVVQEALTNVMKHAGQPATTVTLDYQPGALIVEVADDGGPVPADLPGTGRGLLGLRERVTLYGGELDAGHQPGGGWLVRARIPDELAALPA